MNVSKTVKIDTRVTSDASVLSLSAARGAAAESSQLTLLLEMNFWICSDVNQTASSDVYVQSATSG
jgi:hypothetical protein